VINQVSDGSTAPKGESKDFNPEGKFWKMLKVDMEVGDYDKIFHNTIVMGNHCIGIMSNETQRYL
jgi:hypothetical protein